ncbi:MurR/RpiR family transcriptional regulator [Veronia pacifica]|uniref:MurR/RpiR family transcriptional regulator n=1 Tax=Veronia pacifica TaxID=1080227 RepID=UPI0036456EBA
MPESSFLSRVHDALPDLHPAERKLGELVRDFPGEVASYSASELAKLADVSNATVSRFVRRLGYTSYEEARRDARLEKTHGSRRFLAAVRDTAPRDPLTYADTDTLNVSKTIESIPQETVDDLAKVLLSARKVWVIGFRAGAPLAHYTQWQLLQVIENIVALPNHGQTMGEHLAGIQSNDLVIFFGLRRRISQFDNILSRLISSGASLALISDESLPLNKEVTWHLRCATDSPGPLFSHVSVMALLNLVVNRTIDLAGESGRQRLAAIEAANDALDEL